MNTNSKLLWFKGKLNEKLFDILLDCGASTCCIARRCITSNKVLNSLPKIKYNGPGLIDVNGNTLDVENVVRLRFTAGSPEISIEIDFVVVSQLPYSCIIGTSMLNMLHYWGVDNDSASLYLNSSVIKLYSEPQYENSVNLIVREKITLLPGETKIIKTLARGPAIEAIRPISSSTFISEGLEEYENRTSIRVYPSLNYVGNDNSNLVSIAVKNTSSHNKTLGKGTKIATCVSDFVELNEDKDMINVIDNKTFEIDPIDLMCKRGEFRDFSDEQFRKTKNLLVEFKGYLARYRNW